MVLKIFMAAATLSFALVAQAGETLLTAKTIRTVDTNVSSATAMVYDDSGKILALGDAATLRAKYPKAKTLDVGDATVIPGMIDAHGHLLSLGTTHLRPNLTGTNSKAEIVGKLVDFVRKMDLPKGAWLVGRGWDQNRWTEKQFPTAADLDEAFPDRPVWMRRIDGHAAWANSAALKLVKRDLSGTWQPEGGRIERDASGKPTGVFVDGAMDLVESLIPDSDPATMEKALKLGMQDMVANGLTGVHDAGVSLSEMRLYMKLADRNELPVRITAWADGDGAALDWLCSNGLYQHPSQRLKMRTVKLYADGALGSRGAALLKDYSDDHGNMGLLVTKPDDLLRIVEKARRCKVQVATHAIGDRGNRIVIDTYAKVLGTAAASTDHRWRVEHAQVVELGDIARFAPLHLIASMQPTHATSDMPWAEDRVGSARIQGAYAWRKMRDSSVPLAFGSDFPIESVDPRLGLYAAATRMDTDGKPVGGWLPQEKVTAFEALRGFTLGAAYAGFAEGSVGSLSVGKRADFVVLAEDPLVVPVESLKSLKVLRTYVDGREVYRAE